MKIAIIGSGISALAAAHILHPHHEITLYEKESRVGGHCRTVEVRTPEGIVPVDTGFIVFNFHNYPLLTRLFFHLQVPLCKSSMSFGVRIGEFLEYGMSSPAAMFAQRRNLLRPAFWGMLADILRFRRTAIEFPMEEEGLSLGEYLQRLGYGRWFREYFLLVMGAAIWSTPLQNMLLFPAETFIRFFVNHGILMNRAERPQWYTIRGGSRVYVQRLIEAFRKNIRSDCAAVRILRHSDYVEVFDSRGERRSFSHVILACHADQALSLLAAPDAEEQRILGSFCFQENQVVLHSDTRFMPRRANAWSSWTYLAERDSDNISGVSLSYWMNNLQPLATETPLLVTLNPIYQPAADKIHDECVLRHPILSRQAINAQSEIKQLQGRHRTWYCGAWLGHGFHEDGLRSAVDISGNFAPPPSWK